MEDVKKSKLYTPSLLETKDEVEEKMESGFEAYSKIINGLSEREAHDALTATVSRNMQQYEEITMGLMYVILTDPALASKAYRDLTFISRDGLALVWNRFSQMINERFAKMSDTTRKQVLWFAKEMVKNSVSGVDNVISATVKQVAGLTFSREKPVFPTKR
ncbi:putative integrator complex subunit 3 [Apostichopus japonicus]|uniref:Putative integrator complex subunit 3 n=1 Tax=Stichopus japonicus TaxID=307972 RepID=A0A2G8JFJ5_STIJA|nr:putative integrator complex subunit 3 [Apostichopus japonicus]